jgi:hypothetical protein
MNTLKHNVTKSNQFTEKEWLTVVAMRPKTILSDSNSKLAKDNIYNVDVPAQQALINRYGVVNTCPQAGACKAYCYASSGFFVMHNVLVKQTRNLDYIYNDPFGFANQLIDEIKRKKKVKAIRIHSSGDYQEATWHVYKMVMEACPNIKFYSYTKQISLFKHLMANNELPKNFTVVFSYGGKEDHLIDCETDRHSVVFTSRKNLRQAKYVEAYNTDIPASNPKTMRVGLIVHGNHLSMNKYKKMIPKAMAKAS